MLDNPRLIIVGRGQQLFLLGMQIAFRLHGDKTEAKFWWTYKPKPTPTLMDPHELLGVCAKEFLVLSWAADDSEKHKNVLPAFMACEAASSFAWNWLTHQDYGEQPDHDGSNEKGFVLFNDTWGHVGGDRYAIIGIGPAWALLGK